MRRVPRTDTPGSLAFLQRRVAAYGLAAFGLYTLALAYRVGFLLLRGYTFMLSHPAILWHAAGTLCFLAMWVACRRGQRSRRYIRATEFIGTIAGGFSMMVMGRHIPLVEQPHLIVVMALSYMLFARAVFVPSPAVVTAALTSAVALPALFHTYMSVVHADPELWRALQPTLASLSEEALDVNEVAAMVAGSNALWWAMTLATTTSASWVIYGLRVQVREARTLGQYTLLEKLGEGGMGEVYRARHAMLRRPTAVKLLRPEKVGEAGLKRFEREVQLSSQLTHPNTITIFDYGRTDEGIFYYAMELLEGATLDEIVETSGPMPEARVVHVVSQVAAALTEAHEAGLIHRDIKPSNIILADQGGEPDVAKVLDFGLVKEQATRADPAVSREDVLTGTPLYMAPEAIRAPGAVDARTDLYALGAVTYYLLTGAHVFSGGSLVEICSHHLHTEPEAPSARLGRPVSAGLEALVLACLAKEPHARPESARALRRLLDELDLEGSWGNAEAEAWWADNLASMERARSMPPAAAIEGAASILAVATREDTEPTAEAGAIAHRRMD